MTRLSRSRENHQPMAAVTKGAVELMIATSATVVWRKA